MPSKTTRSTLIVLAVLAVVVVFGGCCSIGGALYFTRRPPGPEVPALEAVPGPLSSMTIMEGGQWVGRIDADGSIWRNGQNVGAIDGDGYVTGSAQGRVDPSTGYIFEGSPIGTVGEDGDLFNPTNVGSIAADGNIVFGTSWGQVQGYKNTPMDRAAVAAYLHFFARAF